MKFGSCARPDLNVSIQAVVVCTDWSQKCRAAFFKRLSEGPETSGEYLQWLPGDDFGIYSVKVMLQDSLKIDEDVVDPNLACLGPKAPRTFYRIGGTWCAL